MIKKLSKSNPHLSKPDTRTRIIQNVASSTAIETGKSSKIYIQTLKANSKPKNHQKR